ncbi:MAG: hypothetical protein HC857_14065 [Synechococcales cyanobacterium RU_4_20]|nr:hypothetical protein [Synechococcales cyanobacterium RU_4_20]
MKTATRSQSAYKTFVEQVQTSQVQQALLKPDRIDYQLKSELGGQLFYAAFGGDRTTLQQLLTTHNVPFVIQELARHPATIWPASRPWRCRRECWWVPLLG